MACLGMVKISVIIRYNFLLLNKLLSPTYSLGYLVDCKAKRLFYNEFMPP